MDKWYFLPLLAAFFIIIPFYPTYGQLHGGHNQAPPIDFGDMQVTVSTVLTPLDFVFDNENSANLAVRFFDSSTNTNIKKVTYRVQIYHNENLVAREYFFDEDGKLDLEIRPKSSCLDEQLWKCTKYFGEKHPIAGALYGRGDNRPIIQGPVFNMGGFYNIKVDIVGATNPKTMTSSDLTFDTFINLPFDHYFSLRTASAEEIPVKVRTTDDNIENFRFDFSDNSFSFDVPFNWNTSYLHQISEVRKDIFIKKSFEPFQDGRSIKAYLDGVDVSKYTILDTKSNKESNLVRLAIHHDELVKITEKLGAEHKNKSFATFKIVSEGFSKMNLIEAKFENGYKTTISWDSKYGAGDKIPFVFSFFYPDGKPVKNIRYAYSIADSSGKEFIVNIGSDSNLLGVVAPDGINTEWITIPSYGKYALKLILTGEGSLDYEKPSSSMVQFEIISSKEVLPEKSNISIPSWIRNNAKWWADGTISDSDFAKGIQHLIKEGVMKIPQTTQKGNVVSQEIPLWVKNNAAWWANNQIDDDSFIRGIQFLIEQGIVKVS